MPARELFTVGYEGKNIAGFKRLLEENGVELLLDVRQHAFSRKPFFSNSGLKKEFQDGAIEYAHVPQLGAPKELRTKLFENQDYAKFFEKYAKHLRKQRVALAQAVKAAEAKRICLMCFEADAPKCHRSVLAKEMRSANDFKIIHLR